MSEGRLHLDEFDIEFLTVLCAEEVMRCRQERRSIRHSEQIAVSKDREKHCMKLVELFADLIDKLDEDDGMEGRPELN